MGGLAWFQRNHTFPFPLAWFQRNHTFPLPSLSLGVGSGEEGSRRWYASRAFFESKRSERAFFESKRSERAFKESKLACFQRKQASERKKRNRRRRWYASRKDGSRSWVKEGSRRWEAWLGFKETTPFPFPWRSFPLAWFQRNHTLSLGVPFPWLGFKETTPWLAFFAFFAFKESTESTESTAWLAFKESTAVLSLKASERTYFCLINELLCLINKKTESKRATPWLALFEKMVA